MDTILVTGSKGLIGRALCRYLRQANIAFKEFDSRLPTHYQHFDDIKNTEKLQAQVGDCQGIIHLAGISRVIDGENNPNLCWETNVGGTEQLLRAAYLSHCRPWVLFASSREVYGQQKKLPVVESVLPQPLNTYARSKLVAENLMTNYLRKKLNTAILRFSNVYGYVDDHSTRVVPAFCYAAAHGKHLKIEGSENAFDFTHVDDVVSGIGKVIARLQRGDVLPIMHFTTGQPTTLRQLAELACSVSKKRLSILEVPSRNFDVSKFYGDPTLAYQTLGWQANIDIVTGVTGMVKEFMEKMQ